MVDSSKPEIGIIVANVGDWTGSLVRKVAAGEGPKQMWIRGVTPPGFMYMHRITSFETQLITGAYSRVVTVVTGAGIAPVLPQISYSTADIYLLWIAKDHETTYGPEVWGIVSKLPSDQIVLHDTKRLGRPDPGEMIRRAVETHKAEAVFVVSNPRYTRSIIEICWRMGIRSYGATWDS
jgi:hypothetical protein